VNQPAVVNQRVEIQIQRYRVSLWTRQFSSPESEDEPLYVRKETVSSTALGALRTIMRQENIHTVYRAKVIAIRSGACKQLEHFSIAPSLTQTTKSSTCSTTSSPE